MPTKNYNLKKSKSSIGFDWRLGVFAALEMIPLKPNKHAGPIQHPQNPISLCALDSLHLKKEGRCELKSVERNPHICEKQEKTQAQTNEIEKAITLTVHIAKVKKNKFRIRVCRKLI